MGFLFFEDDELDDMFKAINNLQICFHPIYAPEGKFSIKGSFELQADNKEVTVIADKNLVSPICEIARTGTLKDKYRLQKVALFVIWTKYLNARLTCGLGLLENDTAGLSTASGEENRLQFLHAVDIIPSTIWKNIAFGYQDTVPTIFLYNEDSFTTKDYTINDNLLLLSNEAAIIKIVQLFRNPNLEPIDKFISFMNWYTDNLDIAESIMVYAAMVFANIPNVAPPKKAKSNSFDQVQKGIKNQAWDITYITTWSMLYYNESTNTHTMFATDDITQKIIIVNILPPGTCADAIDAIFKTKAQGIKLKELATTKLGDARVRPFKNMTEEHKISLVQKLISDEYSTLQKMCNN